MSETIYDQIEREFNIYDASCCLHYRTYKVSVEYADILMGEGIQEGRLAHSHSINHPKRFCNAFTRYDVVNCYYRFGETILHTTHKYGKCPWKTGRYAQNGDGK